MTLRHETVKSVRVNLLACLECASNPKALFSRSRYVERVEQRAPNVYTVRFVWRKLGVTRRYEVSFRVERRGDTIVYESLEGSRYPMRFEFQLTPSGRGTRVRVAAEMKAGLMADLLGRRDFAGFVEELVEKGIVALAERAASKRGGGDCKTCILYDPETGYCYYLRRRVPDPSKPPCKGRAYMAVEGEASP